MHVAAIIAAAGEGRRIGSDRPKQWLDLGGRPILQWAVDAFDASDRVDEIVVVLPPAAASGDQDRPRPEARRTPLSLVAGGARRQDSVANGFDAVAGRADLIVVHDAARPLVTGALIARTLDAAMEAGAALAALPAQDTVKAAAADGRLVERTLARERVYLAQTPQAFRVDVLAAAVALGRGGVEATDEAALAELAGYPVRLVEGDARNLKITTADDLAMARALVGEARLAAQRVGHGYDLHRLVAGRPLTLAGVRIAEAPGPLGHSDGDVVCHALVDALLGAAAAGDIGEHFPDTDARWAGAAGLELLARAAAVVRARGLAVANVDVVVVLERPAIRPHAGAMRAAIARVLEVDAARVSVKGKTNEGVDAVGRGEAIAAHAVVLLAERPPA